jgi:hypothetical protein
MNRNVFHKWAASGALLLVGIVMGMGFQSSNTALGEGRTGPPPTAFQSGSQQSVPILKDIAATLRQMDGRLAKLELAAQKLQTQKR